MDLNPKRGDVFWVAFDPTVGGEIQKTRPAVIISNNDANRILNRVLVVPLTSNTQRLSAGEVLIEVNGVDQKAIASQLRTVSKLRIGNKLGTLSPAALYDIETILIEQLGL